MRTYEDVARHIRLKNPSGLSLCNAHQLCLWLFSVLDVRPIEYRDIPLGREELSIMFSALARDGYIRVPGTIANDGGVITGRNYWDKLIDDLMFKRVSLDEEFFSNAGTYI